MPGIQFGAGGNEHDPCIPEFLVIVVALDATAHLSGRFANIHRWEVIAASFTIADENVDPCFSEFFPLSKLSPFGARESDPLTSPIHTIDDANSLRIAIRHKNANRVWIGHRVTLAQVGQSESLLSFEEEVQDLRLDRYDSRHRAAES